MASTLYRRQFDDAIGRLQTWITEGDYDTPTPFVDALAALYTLREQHRQRLGDATYYPLAAQHAEGNVVEAIVWARGSTAHTGTEGTLVVGNRPIAFGRTKFDSQDTFGGQGVNVVWRQRSELAAPSKPDKWGRDLLYDMHVAGRDVVAAFDDARRFLAIAGAATC